jgi:ferredoxin-NADP reductase
VAFKVGRTVTLGGFKGLFRDRPWKLVDNELEITRLERDVAALRQVHRADVAERDNPAGADDGSVTRVSLDIAERGIAYNVGDRCGVLAVNDPALVARTLAALDATGDEVVPLTPSWAAAMKARADYEGATELRLAVFLRFAKLRPVLRATAKALHAVSVSHRLAEVIEARTEDQWELWDLLHLVHEDGYDVSRLVTSEAWQEEALAHIVPPEPFRMYSVSSAPDAGDDGLPRTLDLTVGSLAYESNGQARTGTASSYLAERADDSPIRIVHPSRFHLPDDPARPIVMFAAGTGIAPFRGFWQTPRTGEAWLFVAARDEEHLLYQDELDAGSVQVRTALSRERRLEAVMQDEAEVLRSLLLEQDAVFYICGRPGFASSVMDGLAAVTSVEAVRQAYADRRLMMDIFTAFAPVTAQRREDAGVHDASEVVLRNDEEHGYWIVVDGMVYDMTEFVHLHPGGRKIILESAGMDASREYRAVLHHQNSEIDAMLSMFKIGAVRRLRFGGEWGIVLTPDGFEYLSLHDAYRAWVRTLYLVVEMQNALGNDFSYMRLPTIRGESGDELTPYKLMLFGNTHLRFFDHYFHGSLGEDLSLLWSVTTGMGAPDQPLKALSAALDAVLSSDEAKRVERFGSRLLELYRTASARLDDAAFWDSTRRLVAEVEAADRAYLTAMKLALREGVKVFEQHEDATMRAGAQALVDVLLGVPDVAAAYYRDLLGRVGAVAPDLLT